MSCSDFIYWTGKNLEAAFRLAGRLPQYKYFAKPIYKLCVEKTGSVAATAITFLSTDLLLHQLGSQASGCLLRYTLNVCEQNQLFSEHLFDVHVHGVVPNSCPKMLLTGTHTGTNSALLRERIFDVFSSFLYPFGA